MKNYPVQKRNTGQHNNPIVPVAKPNIQIPTAFSVLSNGGHSNHNIAGQVYTRVDLQDKNGNRMSIHQRQQVLNLVNGASGCWNVHEGTNRRQHRRFKHVKR